MRQRSTHLGTLVVIALGIIIRYVLLNLFRHVCWLYCCINLVVMPNRRKAETPERISLGNVCQSEVSRLKCEHMCGTAPPHPISKKLQPRSTSYRCTDTINRRLTNETIPRALASGGSLSAARITHDPPRVPSESGTDTNNRRMTNERIT